MAHETLLSIASDIGRVAAEWVRENRPAGRVVVADTKSSPTDVVTALDRGCEELIRTYLADVRPNDAVMGEESDSTPGTTGIEWIIDPIDGTVNFMYGLGGYAVSIGATEHGTRVIGVVIDIETGREFAAIRGKGAWRIVNGQRIALEGPPATPLSHALVGTGFSYQPEIRARQGRAIAELLPHIRDIRRRGSAALDLVSLASGELDAFVEQGLKPWDLAAGLLIAEEAGLVSSGLDQEADERLTMVAGPQLARDFFPLVRRCGF